MRKSGLPRKHGNKMKTYVIGDIHGAHKALVQCLELAQFDYENDRLIVLGDVCDGYPDVKECIDELLKIKRCDFIIGNHDMWALDWALRGNTPSVWTSQGGKMTIASYNGGPMLQEHIDFLQSGHLWLEIDNTLFVHAGFYPSVPMEKQNAQTLVWDRDLLKKAYLLDAKDTNIDLGEYQKVYVGHTTTEIYDSLLPQKYNNVWALDTGAGWSGKLTIMDLDTEDYWQSDLSKDLYGGLPDKLPKKRFKKW